MAHGPSAQQKQFAAEAVNKALNQICDAWDKAVEDGDSFSYQLRNGDPGPRQKGHISDPTGTLASGSANTHDWIRRTKVALRSLLAMSAADHGDGRWFTIDTPDSPLRRDSFHPPSMHRSLSRAVADVVEIWPLRVERLLSTLEKLGGEAVVNWPPTPKQGEVIEGVRVGGRAPTVEICTECRQPIGGGAADPLSRINDLPFHRTPCYQTVWQRNARKANRVTTGSKG